MECQTLSVPRPSSSPIDLEQEEEADIRSKLDTLVSLFPDAEGDFLVSKAREFALNSQFEQFVAKLLDTRDYPVKVSNPLEPSAPLLQDVIKQSFDLDDFLKKYDNPLEHFKSHTTSPELSNLSFMYLKVKFLNKTIRILSKTFNACEHSLFVSFCTLKNLPDDRKTKRSDRELFETNVLHVNSASFVDELMTVEHYEEIENYFRQKRGWRNYEVKKARKSHSLVTCGCCFDDECLFEEMLNCKEGHLFCPACVKKSVQVALGDGKVIFPCLTTCSSTFELDTIEKILHQKAMAALLDKLQANEIQGAGIEGLTNCPFCEYAEIPPEGDRIFHCKKCKKESCISCKKPSHIPLSCEENIQSNARQLIEEKMSETLIRTCYKCHSSFIKVDGCNKMTCSCKAMMCYFCRKPVFNYDHFYNEGTPEPGKCPLYSKNEDLHLKAVLKAGEEAKMKLMQEHPEVAVNYDVQQEFSRHKHHRKSSANQKVDRYNPY